MNDFNAKMIKEFRAKRGKDAHTSSGRMEFDGVPLILSLIHI